MRVCVRMCVNEYVCVSECVREGMFVYVCACAVYVSARTRARVRACVRARVCDACSFAASSRNPPRHAV